MNQRIDGLDRRMETISDQFAGPHRTMIVAMTSIVIAFGSIFVSQF